MVDRTGLAGSYDFSVEWTQGDGGDTALPSLVTALHEQLGLKLEQRKEPIEMLVIDSIDRPTQN